MKPSLPQRLAPSASALRRTTLWLCLLWAAGCAAPLRPQTTPAPTQLTLTQTRPAEVALGGPSLPESHLVWLQALRSAKRQIDVAQFYIANRPGSRLESVIQTLEARARAGVQVRVLVERVFAGRYPATLKRLGEVAEVRVISGKQCYGGGILHAKYFIVDGETAFVGSQNFDWRALEHIHEVGLLVQGRQLARPLSRVFEADWRAAGGGCGATSAATPARPQYVDAQLNDHTVRAAVAFSPPAEGPWDLPELLRMIDGARRRLRVQLLSFKSKRRGGGAWLGLHQALTRAAKRGVQVEVLVAHWSQHHIHELCVALGHPNIQVKMVRLPQAKAGFIPFARVVHAKYMTIDGERAWVGTSNWAWGYFHNSRNVSLFVEGAAMAQRLDQVFNGLWRGPYAEAVNADSRYPRPRVAK